MKIGKERERINVSYMGERGRERERVCVCVCVGRRGVNIGPTTQHRLHGASWTDTVILETKRLRSSAWWTHREGDAGTDVQGPSGKFTMSHLFGVDTANAFNGKLVRMSTNVRRECETL